MGLADSRDRKKASGQSMAGAGGGVEAEDIRDRGQMPRAQMGPQRWWIFVYTIEEGKPESGPKHRERLSEQ